MPIELAPCNGTLLLMEVFIISLLRDRIVRYLVYGLALFGSVIIVFFLELLVKKHAMGINSFLGRSAWVYFALFASIHLPIGIILGIPDIIRQRKKGDKWNVNTKKLLILGIPALYFAIYPITHFYLPFLQLPGIFGLPYLAQNSFKVFAIILGYVITTSFYKENLAYVKPQAQA